MTLPGLKYEDGNWLQITGRVVGEHSTQTQLHMSHVRARVHTVRKEMEGAANTSTCGLNWRPGWLLAGLLVVFIVAKRGRDKV